MVVQVQHQLSDGNRIPVLGLGTWPLVGETCQSVVQRALALGYIHIDTAECYGNQRAIGKALKNFDRSKIFITSKVWRTDLHYEDVLRICRKTLEELDTDYLNLYLIHWPNKDIPIKETLSALKALVEEAKVHSVGVSNFAIQHLKEALHATKIPITVNQIKFHPYHQHKRLMDYCQKHQITVTAYSPLGQGRPLQDRTIREVASKYHRSPAQICLRWGLQKGLAIIPRASSEAHLNENLNIFRWKLSQADMKRIDALNKYTLRKKIWNKYTKILKKVT